MASSPSVLIEDFCQYSCFTAKNLQVKHKGLLKPFIHLCKKKAKQVNFRLKAAPTNYYRQKSFKDAIILNRSPQFTIPLNTSENPSNGIIATFVGGLLLVFFWF